MQDDMIRLAANQPLAVLPARDLHAWSRWAVLVLIVLTACYGVLASFYFTPVNAGLRAETNAAAVNLLERGFIGNPYLNETGPTAHVPPGLVTIMAAVYWCFGKTSPASVASLSLIATLLYSVSQILVLKVLDERRAPWSAYAVLAGLFVLTTPGVYFSVVGFRNWDQPWGAAMLAGAWLLLERAKARDSGYRSIVAVAALTGAASLFSAAVLPPMALASGLMAWRLRGRRLKAMLLAALVIVAGLLPWGLRNQVELHRFILTRSNFFLELALGNMPEAKDGLTGTMDAFVHQYHPFFAPDAAREMNAIGEAAYMDKIGKLAVENILAEPGRFIDLTLRRIAYLIFPAQAMAAWHPWISEFAIWILLGLFAALRLASLAAAAVLDLPLFRDGIVFTALPLLPYVVTHVEYRYTYVIQFTSMVLIACASAALHGRLTRKRGT